MMPVMGRKRQDSRLATVGSNDGLSRDPARSVQLTILWCLILATVVSAVYGRALGGPFIFDDFKSIVENQSITRMWPVVGDADQPGPLYRLHDNPVAGRPLVNFSLALNYRFGQLNPAGYRAVNIFIHILSALLLVAIVRRTLRLPHFSGRFDRSSDSLALAAASLWALHPLQTESVVYITQRTELMVALFYLATLYCCLRFWAAAAHDGRHVWLVLASVAAVAGSASKEVMVTAPLAVLLFDRTFVAGSFANAWRSSRPLYCGLALCWIVLAYLNYDNPRGPSAGFGDGLSATVWWFTQAKVLFLYLKLAVWPAPLAVHYDFALISTLAAAWPWLLMAAALVGATIFLLWRRDSAGLPLPSYC